MAKGLWHASVRHCTSSRISSSTTNGVIWWAYNWARSWASISCTWVCNTGVSHHATISIKSTITPHVIFRTWDWTHGRTYSSIMSKGLWHASFRHLTSSRISSSWTHGVIWWAYNWARSWANISCTGICNTGVSHHASISINSTVTPHVIFRTRDWTHGRTYSSISAKGWWHASVRHWTSCWISSSWTDGVIWWAYNWARSWANISCSFWVCNTGVSHHASISIN